MLLISPFCEGFFNPFNFSTIHLLALLYMVLPQYILDSITVNLSLFHYLYESPWSSIGYVTYYRIKKGNSILRHKVFRIMLVSPKYWLKITLRLSWYFFSERKIQTSIEVPKHSHKFQWPEFSTTFMFPSFKR